MVYTILVSSLKEFIQRHVTWLGINKSIDYFQYVHLYNSTKYKPSDTIGCSAHMHQGYIESLKCRSFHG
jgi:hypothetical protein